MDESKEKDTIEDNPGDPTEAPAESEQVTADKATGQDEPQCSTADENPDDLKAIQIAIDHLEQGVKSIAESSGKTVGEIREIHKLYHNEYANRLKSMQEELEQYHEMDRGRAFDGILGDIAKLYNTYESVLEDIEDVKLKKRIRYMFLDIVQILETNGVSKQKSNPGDKRSTRYCQVVERVSTDNPELHDTIVQSRGTGFYIDNRPLIKELVDIYLFVEKGADKSVED
jgi:predicted house-cleaning noncanonical NTP pyrophosphatase (MazG superfamily)